MTIQEVVNSVKPKSVTLTDGSTTTWNFSLGNTAIWTTNGNNTLSISNVPVSAPMFGNIEIIQGSGGNYIPTLPGNVDGVTWKLNPGDVNWLSFAYDGTTFYWGSLFVIPIIYSTQLLSPGSFTATTSSNTQINLSWSASTNANQYVVQRATNSGMTTNLTTIYTGSGTSFNDTGLTLGTTYYYSIKAQDTTNLYRDSPLAFANATTSGGLIAVTGWGTFTQSPTGTWNGGASETFDKASQRLAANGWVQMDVPTSTSQLVILGMDDSATVNSFVDGSVHSQWLYSVYVGTSAGNHYNLYLRGENANVIDSGIGWVAGDKVRLNRTGTTVVCEKSSDGGTTWTTVHTCTVTSAANLYIKADIFTPGQKLVNPQGNGIS